MDRININNLFPKNRIATNDNPLDVKSLFKCNPALGEKKSVDFSVDGLLIHKEERKKKIRDQYRKTYNMVLNKIKIVNKINDTTDIIYDVPEAVFGLKEYNSHECLEYIENKLRNLYYMDTLKLSSKSMFISWKSIENNRKKHQETHQEKENNK